MKYKVMVLILLSFVSYSQTKTDSINKLTLAKIALINQTDSYVTFPTDIGNIAPLMFEGNISPSFVIRQRKDSKLMAVLTAQIIIRMYNEESFPVRTPSYIPQISFYYRMSKKASSDTKNIFARIAHHSNGQDGDYYNEDGTVNLISGNFATNFFELGYINTFKSNQYNAVRFYKSSIEVHPKSWMAEEIQGSFSGFRWNNSFIAYKLSKKNAYKDKKPNFSIKIETTYMMDAINEWNFIDIKRLNASFTFYYHPHFLEDIGFFVQYYTGRDYYNIYFNEYLSVIRFGIMTEILRF